MRNTRPLLLVILLVVCACGSERIEAVRFCQVLNQNQMILAKANADESSLVAAIARWADGVAFSGGPSIENISRSKDFAKKADSIRAQLAAARQALEAEALDHAFNQTIRSNLVTSLRSREELLEEVELLLEQSAEAFPRMDLFQYPGSINALLSKLQPYSPPQDVFVDAIKEVRTKFEISDSELNKS